MSPETKPRVPVFIVAYFAESTILKVLERIPVLPGFEVEVLITRAQQHSVAKSAALPAPAET